MQYPSHCVPKLPGSERHSEALKSLGGFDPFVGSPNHDNMGRTADLGESGGQFIAAHLRHVDRGYQQINRVSIFGDSQPFCSSRSGKDRVADERV
jgi:hypothetical protein